MVNQACIYWDRFNFENVKYHDSQSGKKTLPVKKDCILINSTGTGTLGRCNVFPELTDGYVYVVDSHVTVLAESHDVNAWTTFSSAPTRPETSSRTRKSLRRKSTGPSPPLWHSTALPAAGTIRPSLSMAVEVYCLFDNRQVLTNLSFFIHYNENKSRANEV